MRPALSGLLLVACLWPSAAPADIYRCLGKAGKVSFVGDPSACPGATPHEPRGDVQYTGRSEADAPDPPAARAPLGLESLFPGAATLPGRWDVVKEARQDPSGDPDLVGWGVHDKAVRHYTHYDRQGRVRVCSVELWAFDSAAGAGVAEQLLSYPNWRFQRSGALLVMIHSVSRERGERASRELFAECLRLGDRIASRAEKRSR